jgi:hypothetical protein
MKLGKTIIIAVIIFVIAGGAIYYFGFIRESSEQIIPTVRIDVAVPELNVAVLQTAVFKEMQIFAPLPLSVGGIGNTLPFTQINFLSTATTTPSQ